MELTQWKLPCGTYTMEAPSWSLHHGICLMDFTIPKLPHGTNTKEVT